jgi:ATP-dependent helicase STH1/SNF2
MVIAPLSTISNWQNEFERWAPSVVTWVYKGNPQERKDLYNTYLKEGRFNVMIIQFELVMDKQDSKRLKTIDWSYIIVDEGHRLKNRESKLFTCLTGRNGYKASNRVILSGTPLQNEIHELWSLLNFLLPEVFDTNEDFEEWFTKPFKTGDEVDVEVVDEEKEFLIKCLHAVLRPFMTRRLKADLQEIMQLPEARENILKCELSSLQKVLYLQTENHVLTSQTADGASRQRKMSNRIAQLRKVCNHPFLFDEYDLGDEYLVRSCGKFALLDRILPKLKVAGHRVLIYSQMVKLLHLLERYCISRRYEHLLLSGESSSEDRIDMMRRWNEENSKYFVFMLSTRAGGQGINLQTADTVIIYDSDWNPMMDEQAKARVHRIGQTKQCLVLRLVTPNTVEEKVTKRAEERLRNEDLAIETGKFNLRTEVSQTHELLRTKLASEFADKMMQAREHAHTDEQINELIARTDDEIEWFNRMDEEREVQIREQVRRGALKPPQPRLMTDDELPSWLLGEPVFMDDKVIILAECTSADMRTTENIGVVIGEPSVSDPLFTVELPDGTVKKLPRTQIRVCNDEQDRFREDLGYGRGQRDRKEIARTGDYSDLSEKEFQKRILDDSLDEVCCVCACVRMRLFAGLMVVFDRVHAVQYLVMKKCTCKVSMFLWASTFHAAW